MLRRLMQHLNRVDPYAILAGFVTASWIVLIMNLCATDKKINLGDTLDFCFISTSFLGLFCGLTYQKSARLGIIYFSSILFVELTIAALSGAFNGIPLKIMASAIIVTSLSGAVSAKVGTVIKNFFCAQFHP